MMYLADYDLDYDIREVKHADIPEPPTVQSTTVSVPDTTEKPEQATAEQAATEEAVTEQAPTEEPPTEETPTVQEQPATDNEPTAPGETEQQQNPVEETTIDLTLGENDLPFDYI